MIDPIPFLSPRMEGERFDAHAIPLELLKDLAVLEEMVIEVAKWRYLQDHEDRKRTPRGFTDGIALKLTAVEPGSAIPRIDLFAQSDGFFPPGSQVYFEQGREHILGAIDAANRDGRISDYLPESLLGYFDRIGRSLREGEAIIFDPRNVNRPARLTRSSRRKLLLASSQTRELTEEVTLRGTIPEADQDRMTFDLQVTNGPRVTSPLALQHLPTVLEAFNGFQKGTRVQVRGIGRFNRNERLQGLAEVEHIGILDANDVAARLDDLRGLKNGWLDGRGFAPSPQGLDWLARCFGSHYPDLLPPPYLYPTAEGGVQAEWSLGTHEISLEIDLDRRAGEWHSLDTGTHVDDWKELDLAQPVAWAMITAEIEQQQGLAVERA
ncbi:hypothetical protein [uncultured Lamprocystis sp.]|jgi:hypothetical protein|uniref:hypothetical protein n=1 Tax=uncultured Lamprocystis sp. TaxID=543132 RepID=UPI0025FC4F38|nr:hypothetical protein [uncultured Lamprocystis sp.]